ncbi:MAG TPA: DUF6311 domain-containing protein [Burkholderiaceae bacterium]|nr:DUF6311 domain-containing protein [Burkholderiaceae bacterium]
MKRVMAQRFPNSGLDWRDFGSASAFGVYLSAAMIACGFVIYLFPLSFLQGHSSVTDFGDISQHISGWWYYMHEPWHLPLLHTYKLDHPDGVSIAFTDSIPLAALFFKLLITLLPNAFPAHFHYFGWWIGFVFIAQAVSATFLIRALGAKSWFAMAIAVGFALTWPVLHARYHHSALMTQSIILFGLAFYWLGQKRAWTRQGASGALIGLSVVALMVHPYYLAMTVSLFIAFLVDQILKKESWLLQLTRLLSLLVLLGALVWLLGYTRHSAYDALGYGDNGYGNDFFLNLLEPFCGGGKLIACGAGPEFVFPYRESFNYLGAGFLLLIPVALFSNRQQLFTLPKHSPALTALLLGFFLYAISNKIRFGNSEIFSYTLPAWTATLTGTFRAAGRFFWPISIFVLYLTLASLLKKRSWFISLILLAALVIQVKDVKPWLLRIQTESSKPSSLNFKEWETVMTHVDKVMVYPIHECPPLHYQHNIWIMRLAGYYGKQINSGYTARGHKDCDADALSLQQDLKARHLYIISSGAYSNTPFTENFIFPKSLQRAMEMGECVRRLDDMICLAGSSPAFWESQPLVTSPIRLIPQGRQWMPAEFSTEIGVAKGQGLEQRMVPKDMSKPGWLGFGPFVYLPEGKYRYVMEYSSTSDTSAAVGYWDVTLDNTTTLGSGVLHGTIGKKLRIEGVINLVRSQAGHPLEMRTQFIAKGDLQLFSTSIQKIP